MNMFKQMSTIMTMHGKQVCDQWDLVQFSDSGVSPLNGMQFQIFLGQLMQMRCLNVHLLNSPHNIVMKFMIWQIIWKL